MIRLELFKDKTVTSSWYDIWAAAVAVNQMCVVQGRSGQALDVGPPTHQFSWSKNRSHDASVFLDQAREPMHDVQEKANIKTIGWPANLLVQMVSGGRNPVAEVGGSTAT
ncbi:hypothetical protein XPA_009341 [Xanthoria parietina]